MTELSGEDHGVEEQNIPEPEGLIGWIYQTVLGRIADQGGLTYWVQMMTSGEQTATGVIQQIAQSEEFKEKNLQNSETVVKALSSMMGEPAESGENGWMEELNDEDSLLTAINGFSATNQFARVRETFGIENDFAQGQNGRIDITGVRSFVTQCYQQFLGREPDPSGMNKWSASLAMEKKTAAEVIYGFVLSEEFGIRGMNHGQIVDSLYRVMLNRNADAGGRAFWQKKLDDGGPIAEVINGICGSEEFRKICSAYGIAPGRIALPGEQTEKTGQDEENHTEDTGNTITAGQDGNNDGIVLSDPETEEKPQSDSEEKTEPKTPAWDEGKAEDIVGRCYRTVLGREGSSDEKQGWISRMMTGGQTPGQVIRGFLTSEEFRNRNLSYAEIIRIMYRIYLNRECSETEAAGWIEKLEAGESVGSICNGFAYSDEFRRIEKTMRR